MMRFVAFFSLLVACGGQTTTPQDGGADAPIAQCHGFCPQPNGATCGSDCDCENKCIAGICKDPIAPSVSCGDASACPSGQQCDAFGFCAGAACTSTDQCPVEQQCSTGACTFFGCI